VLEARLANARIPLQIDVGLGDVITLTRITAERSTVTVESLFTPNICSWTNAVMHLPLIEPSSQLRGAWAIGILTF
jgi:hypothetical protein